jgi:hypothetical protein
MNNCCKYQLEENLDKKLSYFSEIKQKRVQNKVCEVIRPLVKNEAPTRKI